MVDGVTVNVWRPDSEQVARQWAKFAEAALEGGHASSDVAEIADRLMSSWLGRCDAMAEFKGGGSR